MKKISPLNFQTLSAPIYQDLMEQLISGVYEPGQRLKLNELAEQTGTCLLYTSPSPRDAHESRMPSSA